MNGPLCLAAVRVGACTLVLRLAIRPTAHTVLRGRPVGAPSTPGPEPTLRKFSARARQPSTHHTRTVLYRHPSSATFLRAAARPNRPRDQDFHHWACFLSAPPASRGSVENAPIGENRLPVGAGRLRGTLGRFLRAASAVEVYGTGT